MQSEVIIRICSTCTTPLPFNEQKLQEGIICCDEYFCNTDCLLGTRTEYKTHDEWVADHYEEEGECYFSEWELEELEVVA